MPAQHTFQAPTGTRDLYPVEAARRRYITEAWRRVAINHGFEEIDGPTFEHLDLYTVKSGEGIVSELFSFRREGGEKDYALRPEFTPTLARMYAAKAASLPKPTKWFSVGPYFRAERPQRGRLREFLQWNCDVIGLAGEPQDEESDLRLKAQADSDSIICIIALLRSLGLSSADVSIRLSHRSLASELLFRLNVDTANVLDRALQLLDRASKLDPEKAEEQSKSLGFSLREYREHAAGFERLFKGGLVQLQGGESGSLSTLLDFRAIRLLREQLEAAEVIDWCTLDVNVARGLAYYTGTVFEVVVDNERAIAGGGRYDNLIELFGGPPTPAVGFGMGDVVLSLVLQDKGLMPSDAELMGLADQTPDVFVIAATPDAEPLIPRVLADLRRATPRSAPQQPAASSQHPAPAPGLHARRSYKTTKNVGKLLQEAGKLGARFSVIIESADAARIKDMATGAQDDRAFPLQELGAELRRRCGR